MSLEIKDVSNIHDRMPNSKQLKACLGKCIHGVSLKKGVTLLFIFDPYLQTR